MRAISLVLLWGLLASFLNAGRLSPLSSEPDWKKLHEYHFTITRERFEKLLDQVYSVDGGMRAYLRISPESFTLFSDSSKTSPLFSLFFSNDFSSVRPNPHFSRYPENPLGEKSLQGLRICLDPGHIGGEFSKLEERFFKIEGDSPVEEAKLNLMTCRIIESQLKAYGAEVVWTKEDEVPVTPIRPADLRQEALQWIFDLGSFQYLPVETEIVKRANMLFYRTAEIRARADRIQKLKPDLTVCLHYNAGDWGANPLVPKLVEKSRLVLFITGGFMANELKYDDQKFDLISQLLEQNYELELGLSAKISKRMKETFQMDPEQYKNWGAVVPIKEEPYVYARNLAANRWFVGPTVFVEGPYMNAKDAYDRIIAGDYEGQKEIQGKMTSSIHHDFALSVVQGIVDYYRQTQKPNQETRKFLPTVWNP